MLLVLSSGTVWAQATAELAGRVTDESDAVLPGVTVTAAQTDTGFTRTVVTDNAGTWVMPNLPTGPYRLEVALQGFRTYVQTGIVLQVDARPTINAALGVGNIEETVSVEAAAPIVDVRSAGISAVVEQERIVELRAEVFNVLNNFNWGDPNLNFSAGTFGRITTTAGDPRILQFGVKYGF
jgi:hypothetical protein